jgi:putative nucleotidyltransferase with HDIG domain
VPLRIDRELLGTTEEVFKALGVALMELQLLTRDHPRFQKTTEHLTQRLDDFFSQTVETPRLTFTIRREQAEFRKIPLVNLGTHGARLIKSLQLFNAAGFQLEKGISQQEAANFVETVLEWSRKTHDGPEGRELPTGAGFCLLSEDMVQELRNASVAEQVREPLVEPSLVASIPEVSVSTVSFDRLLDGYRSQLSNLRAGNEFDHETLERLTENVVEQFRTEDEPMLPLHSESYFDDFTFHHSVNVCLITVYLARRLTGDTELLRRIGNAALLHDIGKSKIPTEVLYKPGRLTEVERECLEEHPVRGAELLLSMPQIDDLTVAVAFGHHMHDAAGSYPRTQRPFQCDWVTELVGVVDIYEALTAIRPYKAGLSSETAFKVMLDMPGLKKRLHFVKLLYNCLGPYPPGALLQLDTGAWAVSVQHNALAPYAPRIRVLTDAERVPLATPYVIDLDVPAAPHSETSIPRIVRQIVVQEPAEDSLQAEPVPEPREILGRPLHDDKALMLREG